MKIFCRLKKRTDQPLKYTGLLEVLNFVYKGDATYAVCTLLEDSDEFLEVMKTKNITREEAIEKYGCILSDPSKRYNFKGRIYVYPISDIYIVNDIDEKLGVLGYTEQNINVDQ